MYREPFCHHVHYVVNGHILVRFGTLTLLRILFVEEAYSELSSFSRQAPGVYSGELNGGVAGTYSGNAHREVSRGHILEILVRL